MFQLDENNIKKYTNELSYKRGKNYYESDYVLSMDVDDRHGYINIYAEVESASDAWIYDAEVSFNKEGFLDCNCDCEAFNSYYGGKYFCKHIVAALLKYIEEESKYKKVQNIKPKNELISQLKNITLNDINKQSGTKSTKKTLDLKINYENQVYGRERVSSVDFRVGENKLYVVKGLSNFIESIVHSQPLEFGKNFTYDPSVHSFSQEDRDLIKFLIELWELDKRFRGNGRDYYFGYSAGLFSGKKVYLTDLQLNKFFHLVAGRTIAASIQGKEYNPIEVVKENLPLEFKLDTDLNNNIKLMMNGEAGLTLDSYGNSYLYKDKIYLPSEEQRSIYAPFYNELIKSKDRVIKFEEQEGEDLASYIIPNLKAIASNIKIDKRLKEKFYEEKLRTEIYFDKADEAIAAEIKYHYGEVSINAFKDNKDRENKNILIRDTKGELEVLNILLAHRFEKREDRVQLSDEENIIDFLTNGIDKLQEKADIFYSESFKNFKVYKFSNIKSNIRLNEEDFLEFSFSIDGINKNELKDILSALKQKKKYYKLKEGGFIDLQSKEINDVGTMIEYLDIKEGDLEKDKILLSKYNALYMDQKIKNSTLNNYVERNKKFREMINNIKEVQEMDFEVPESLKVIMRGYQKTGFKWFKILSMYGFGGILADEMGLGKTLQTIAFIQSEIESNEKQKRPALVVAPTSLVYNWESEISKFAPSLKSLVLSGSKKEREELFKEVEACDVVITSYPLIRRDIEEYKDIKFSYCILDEAQQIKNANSINAKSVKEINARGYFALTGTPIENSLMELWSIFDFVMPGYLLSSNKFSQKYESPIVKNKDKETMEELNRHIKPFILRRLKKEVIKELPPKIEHKLVVEMSEEQKKLYVAYVQSLKKEIDEEIAEKGLNKSKIKILAALTRLRQICCDPSVFIENFNGDSGKLLALDDVLEESINSGHRILLFSQFTSVLKNIQKRLERGSIEFIYLDGSTKSEDRGIMVKEFNEGRGQVFLISLKAGGTGLNLTGADTVIHFDPWWNPAVEDQASDRAHRIGQKNTVEVIKLIAKGTIEEKIYELQQKKKEIIKNVIDDNAGEESLINEMSKEQLEELFSYDV